VEQLKKRRQSAEYFFIRLFRRELSTIRKKLKTQNHGRNAQTTRAVRKVTTGPAVESAKAALAKLPK